jgi:nitroreductase
MTMIMDLIARNRSYRRFKESQPVSRDTLCELLQLARLAASGSNTQPLKYMLSADREINAKIFPCLAWAGHLRDWDGPVEGERPAAYIIILGDTNISKGFGVDHGIAAQNILLGAVERGLGGCMLGAVQREKLREVREIPEHYEVLLVVALGEPAEKVVIDDVGPDGDTKYWRDADDVHHVPKRTLEQLIVG